jgi:hypothetical protein
MAASVQGNDDRAKILTDLEAYEDLPWYQAKVL